MIQRTREAGGRVHPQIAVRAIGVQIRLSEPGPFGNVPAVVEVVALPLEQRASLHNVQGWLSRVLGDHQVTLVDARVIFATQQRPAGTRREMLHEKPENRPVMRMVIDQPHGLRTESSSRANWTEREAEMLKNCFGGLQNHLRGGR